MSKNYYDILEINKDADLQTVKNAYRTLAKKYHPDKTNGGSAEKFREVAEAYEVLGNVTRREEYDNSRREGVRFRFDSTDFSAFDAYEDYFNSWADQFSYNPRDLKGSDVNVIVRLTLEELKQGCKKEIRLSENRIRVSIPSDTEPGTKIVIRGKGEKSKYPDCPEGDLYVTIKSLSHAEFTLLENNKDISSELELTYPELILGATKVVPTLLNKYKINVPKLSKPESKMKLKGLGINGGDMYIKLKLLIPEDLTDEEIELIIKLDKVSRKR